MKRTDLAYIAGIIDGEGWIGIAKNKQKEGGYVLAVRIGVHMTDEYIPTWLHFAFGGSLCCEKQKTTTGKTVWKWELSGELARSFLKDIYPYLILKKPQAEVVFKFLSLMPRGKKPRPLDRILQEELREAIGKYNRKGKKD